MRNEISLATRTLHWKMEKVNENLVIILDRARFIAKTLIEKYRDADLDAERNKANSIDCWLLYLYI